ncbi:MAG: hypothetical protein WAP51_04605 [Candidatus Sungiibacteriota bacterium]
MKKEFVFIGGILAGALLAYLALDVLKTISDGNDFLNPPRAKEEDPADKALWIGS